METSPLFICTSTFLAVFVLACVVYIIVTRPRHNDNQPNDRENRRIIDEMNRRSKLRGD